MARRRQRRSRNSSNPANPSRGDIPRPIKRTYETESCKIPRTTDQCTLRGSTTSVVQAVGTGAGAAQYVFTLAASGLPTGGFDQYRINCIRFTIVPQNNSIGLVTNSTTSLVSLYCVIDYDDANALGGVTSAQAYDNVIVLNPGESLERKFRPHMATAAYSGTFTGFANELPQWLDTASSGVQHYGVKIYIPIATTGQTTLQSWDVITEYWIDFKNSI